MKINDSKRIKRNERCELRLYYSGGRVLRITVKIVVEIHAFSTPAADIEWKAKWRE